MVAVPDPDSGEPEESSSSTDLIAGVVGALVVVAGFAAVKRKSMVSNPRSCRTEDAVNSQYGDGIEVSHENRTKRDDVATIAM